MLVVLGLASLFVVISIIWPIVAIAKEQSAQTEYTFTASIAGWYAQIMAMVVSTGMLAKQSTEDIARA